MKINVIRRCQIYIGVGLLLGVASLVLSGSFYVIPAYVGGGMAMFGFAHLQLPEAKEKVMVEE